MQKEDVRSLWDSDWLPNISGKQALYKGLAQYFQSKVAAENKEIGEEIARQVFFKAISQIVSGNFFKRYTRLFGIKEY